MGASRGRFRSLHATTLALSLVYLAACGGGGGGGGSGGGGASAGSVLSGSASKGPLKGATVCVYAADAGAANGQGAKISLLAGSNVSDGCFVTGADGSYALTLPAGASRDVVVVASGGSYCSDESQVLADNSCGGGATLLTVGGSVSLRAAATLPANDGNATLHVTPLSEAAWRNALANHTTFAAEFAALKTALGLADGITPGTAPTGDNELKTLLGQIAVSVATQGSSDLGAAIATLAGGSTPQTGAPGLVCSGESTLDGQLRCLLNLHGVTRLEEPPAVNDALYNAGVALFSSTVLSGTGTVSCATCHPTNNAGVEKTLSLHASLRGAPNTIHRNSPDLVNKLLGGRKFLFWDGRVAVNADGSFVSPVGNKLPSGLDSMLAVQALLPLLSRDEMLGYVPGSGSGVGENTLAGLVAEPEADPQPVWNALMDKVKANATLLARLREAYPNVADTNLGIQHVANAIAAFQTKRWNGSRPTANFHGYLAGPRELTDSAKRGGILFFDKAGCYRCHNGPLLSDQKFHNLAVPQIGPGFGSGATATPAQDKGRYEVTGAGTDLYAFLTPSLWEAKVTAPYMHNGVYTTLEKAIRHHLDAGTKANAFRCTTDLPSQSSGIALSCRDSESAPTLYADMVSKLAAEMRTPIALSDAEITDLIIFINTLNDGAN